MNIGIYVSPNNVAGYLALYRNNSTNLVTNGYYAYQAGEFNYSTFTFMDTPNTTSATTYSPFARINTSGQVFDVNYSDAGGQVRSTITVMEIAQ
jgi:hypothetical protein